MSIVKLLDEGIKSKNWDLIIEAFDLIVGKQSKLETKKETAKTEIFNENPFMINKPVSVKKEQNVFEPMQNKFVDDLSLEAGLIEKSSKTITKKYRKPAESDYVDVKCSKCGATSSITLAEQRFKSIDSESAPFTCIKCIRSNRRS